jgi:hypothetical protein
MDRILAIAIALLGAVASCFAQPTPPALSSAHDGRWSVSLVCPDAPDQYGGAKGYGYNFAVQIVGGQLDGRFDESAPPAFVHFAGQVLADGTLSISANGLSGAPDSTIGKIPRGTPYRYTMKGKLDADRGKAERIELRACTAEFVRQY